MRREATIGDQHRILRHHLVQLAEQAADIDRALGRFEAFARARGTDPTDLDTQIAFIFHELETTEARAWAQIRANKMRSALTALGVG
jgi:hypothetical protein